MRSESLHAGSKAGRKESCHAKACPATGFALGARASTGSLAGMRGSMPPFTSSARPSIAGVRVASSPAGPLATPSSSPCSRHREVPRDPPRFCLHGASLPLGRQALRRGAFVCRSTHAGLGIGRGSARFAPRGAARCGAGHPLRGGHLGHLSPLRFFQGSCEPLCR